MDRRFDEILEALTLYFDGLYYSDVERLKRVFHPAAHYVSVSDGVFVHRTMDEYLPIVAGRASPASRGEPRADAVDEIAFAGPLTAAARLRCAIGPKRFIDLLTLVKDEREWRIISKVFHFDLVS